MGKEGGGVREGHGEGGGIHPGVYRFMALTSASFSTHCSEPVCHAPHHHHLLAFAISPLVSSKKERESLGGGAQGKNRFLFPGRSAVPGTQGHI